MKTLTVIRHAKSSWNHPGLADFDRPLNPRGERDAPYMGARLAGAGLSPDLIVCSPAARARATCKCLADALEYPADAIHYEKAIYEAELEDLMDVVQALDPKKNTVCLVGHNPGFTDLARHLSGEALDALPTCGVVHIQWANGNWTDIKRGSGEVIFVDFPKNDGKAPRIGV